MPSVEIQSLTFVTACQVFCVVGSTTRKVLPRLALTEPINFSTWLFLVKSSIDALQFLFFVSAKHTRQVQKDDITDERRYCTKFHCSHFNFALFALKHTNAQKNTRADCNTQTGVGAIQKPGQFHNGKTLAFIKFLSRFAIRSIVQQYNYTRLGFSEVMRLVNLLLYCYPIFAGYCILFFRKNTKV